MRNVFFNYIISITAPHADLSFATTFNIFHQLCLRRSFYPCTSRFAVDIKSRKTRETDIKTWNVASGHIMEVLGAVSVQHVSEKKLLVFVYFHSFFWFFSLLGEMLSALLLAKSMQIKTWL